MTQFADYDPSVNIPGSSPDPEGTVHENGRYLKNPLPLPKRRPHVRMEFDLADAWDIPDEQAHFDYEIDDDDDFDI